MINQFRKLSVVNIFFLAVIAFILRFNLFLQSPRKLNLDFLNELFPYYTNIIISYIIVLVQAILFNRIITNHNLLGKSTFLPALLYITTSSLFIPFLFLSPTLIDNFILLWIIHKLLNIYKQKNVIALMFDMGMLIAIGTFIYFPFIALLPLLWISLLIFRPFNWREWTSGIIGFITIFFFIAVGFYWNDSLDQFFHFWNPIYTPFSINININLYNYIILLPLIFILLMSLVSIRQGLFRNYVHIRKSFKLLLYILILILLSFLLNKEYNIYHFILSVPIISIFTAYYFLNATKSWFYESLYILLLAFIIYFQIF